MYKKVLPRIIELNWLLVSFHSIINCLCAIKVTADSSDTHSDQVLSLFNLSGAINSDSPDWNLGKYLHGIHKIEVRLKRLVQHSKTILCHILFISIASNLQSFCSVKRVQ